MGFGLTDLAQGLAEVVQELVDLKAMHDKIFHINAAGRELSGPGRDVETGRGDRITVVI